MVYLKKVWTISGRQTTWFIAHCVLVIIIECIHCRISIVVFINYYDSNIVTPKKHEIEDSETMTNREEGSFLHEDKRINNKKMQAVIVKLQTRTSTPRTASFIININYSFSTIFVSCSHLISP